MARPGWHYPAVGLDEQLHLMLAQITVGASDVQTRPCRRTSCRETTWTPRCDMATSLMANLSAGSSRLVAAAQLIDRRNEQGELGLALIGIRSADRHAALEPDLNLSHGVGCAINSGGRVVLLGLQVMRSIGAIGRGRWRFLHMLESAGFAC